VFTPRRSRNSWEVIMGVFDTTKNLESKVKDLSKKKAGKQAEVDILKPKIDKLQEKYDDAKEFVDNEFKGDANAIANKCQTHFGKRLMSLNEAKEALRKMEKELEKQKTAKKDAEEKVKDLGTELGKVQKNLKWYTEGKAKLEQDLKGGKLTKDQYNTKKEALRTQFER
jgi:predicted  nucleic acid-binding Zn-ribbon protein